MNANMKYKRKFNLMFSIMLVYINHNRINSVKICVSKDLVNENDDDNDGKYLWWVWNSSS